MIAFENKPEIGKGIYTTPDVAKILGISYDKANRWIKTYWDGKLSKDFQEHYSWKVDGSRAISFHTLIELFVMGQFSDAGVKPNDVIIAHKELSNAYNSRFPFALREVIDGMRMDPGRKKIFWEKDGAVANLNGSKQLNLHFIKLFLIKLDFDHSNMANKFWPMGKDHSIVIDPERKFGHPILNGRNIYPEIIHGHFKAGDSIQFISCIFEISEKEVKDAIKYCEAA
ncbi:MAG: DUF433 domain-containing protein [Cytophagales bacterium]|nr:DUF433 domain-containing protein [Cytophagales bacterium]|tara:strand:+ start:57419 stop:58099 length:681 start_codon:yes stop_codon:yes gene_type:complete